MTKVSVHNIDHSLCAIAQHMDVKSTTHCTSLSSLIGFLRTLAKCDITLNKLQSTVHKRFHFLVQMGHKQVCSANSTRSDTVLEQPWSTLTPKQLQCIKVPRQMQRCECYVRQQHGHYRYSSKSAFFLSGVPQPSASL